MAWKKFTPFVDCVWHLGDFSLVYLLVTDENWATSTSPRSVFFYISYSCDFILCLEPMWRSQPFCTDLILHFSSCLGVMLCYCRWFGCVHKQVEPHHILYLFVRYQWLSLVDVYHYWVSFIFKYYSGRWFCRLNDSHFVKP